MKVLNIFVALAALAAPIPGWPDNHVQATGGSAVGSAADGLTEGEVRKVDTEQGKVTLKHGAIENLGMPSMTMIFRASDPAMLSKLKVGDKVKFKADRVNGALTITEIAAAS